MDVKRGVVWLCIWHVGTIAQMSVTSREFRIFLMASTVIFRPCNLAFVNVIS